LPHPAPPSGPRLAVCKLASIAIIALLACTSTADAGVFTEGDSLMLQAGPYVYHKNDNPDHNNEPLLVGVEWESVSRWEVGASYFENSFYQPCIYIYVGKRWFLGPADDGFYLKLTGGPLYGYKDEYEDKVPFNHNGLGLAILPAVGYQYERANVQLVTLGTAGVLLTIGYEFWK
jgi:hypothetical protein